MKNNTRVTALSTGVLMLFVLFVVAQDVSAQMGNRQGGGMQGANMIDENNNGVPDGMEDADGDGIMNRDDDDHEKEHINKGDGDGLRARNQAQNREVVMGNDGDNDDAVRGLRQMDGEPVQLQQRTHEAGMGTAVGTGAEQGGQMQMQKQGTANGDVRAENRVQNRINNPGIGEQARVMAQRQVQREDAIQENIQSAQRSGMAQFFMGSDKEKMNVAREELGQYNKDLEQMKGLYAEGDLAPDDAFQIQNQIQEMEQVRTQLDQQVEEGGGFSLFGWLTGLTS